jgi:hypothetical protein
MTLLRVLTLAAGVLLASGPAALAGGQTAAVPPPAAAPAQSSNGNVERGRYLVERVAMCVECHSGRDRANTLLPHERYMGGPIPFRPPVGWADRAPRIAGLPGYSDSQARDLLMLGGIGRHGAVLRAPMPRFHMSEADANDVIAFLRSIR